MDQLVLGIDIGSNKILSIIADLKGGSPRVIGVGVQPSDGIQKGAIKSIDLASKAVRKSLESAQQMAGGVDIKKAYISLSGNCVRGDNISAAVNLSSNSEIGIAEINRIMQTAAYTAKGKIPNNYEVVHILPYAFDLDSHECIDDPFGMIGERLDVSARIVSVHKSYLANLKKVVEDAGIEVLGVVLSAYASSIATLSDDEKELGVCCVDMGGDCCNFMIHRGNSMQYDDFLGVGSWNVTNDIATVLNTPSQTAEYLKIKYDLLKPIDDETKESTFQDVPQRNGELRVIRYEIVHSIVVSRILDMLRRIEGSIEASGLKNMLGAGIVFTGGMASMTGLKEVAKGIFQNLSIRIAEPRDINDSFNLIKDTLKTDGLPYTCASTAIGLILYASGKFTNYELDSNKKMKIRQSERILQSKSPILSDIERENNLQDIKMDEEQGKNERINLNDNKESVVDKVVNWVKSLF